VAGLGTLDGSRRVSVAAITTALTAADAETAKNVNAYERDHKDRAGVIDAADKRAA
jgi:hypothetical protein